MKKLIFTQEKPSNVLLTKKKLVFSFLNMYSLYLFKKEKVFTEAVSNNFNLNFPDGKPLAWRLGTPQIRGPTFTKKFLSSPLAKEKKHFFVGGVDLKKISNKTNIAVKNLAFYNPPHISGYEFSVSEMDKIIYQISKFKPNYIWVCVGNPKQEILSAKLYKKYPAFYLNVGAATDFLLENKQEAPHAWRKLGLEWLYRLITDFKYSQKKVYKSFLALGYLDLVKQKELRKIE